MESIDLSKLQYDADGVYLEREDGRRLHLAFLTHDGRLLMCSSEDGETMIAAPKPKRSILGIFRRAA